MIRGLPDAWEGDGIVSFHGHAQPFIDWLNGQKAPVVDMGEYGPYSQFARVEPDNDRIAALAVEHFASRGYRRLGFVWLYENQVKRTRLEETKRAAEARGLEFLDVPLDRIGRLAGENLFPLALLASNDAAAVRALSACEDANVLVPEQAAILGIDNFTYRCEPASVPLSSIDPDQERVGYEAAALLDRLMRGERKPEGSIKIEPVGIVQRESTDMVAIEDLEVARALRYVIANFKSRVGLRDVARATSISLRRLQTRFKEQVGRTILQEINGRRVQLAQDLLAQSGKKIRSVAQECGFGSSVKLIRVFKQYVGTSPKRFRREAGRAEDRTAPAANGISD
jgi:LacI family transcriptional regulator